MTSLCRHLSAQEIVNWVTTADGCVHTDDTTKLSPTCEFVFTPPTPTRQNSFRPVGVGGVYWALGRQIEVSAQLLLMLIVSVTSIYELRVSSPLRRQFLLADIKLLRVSHKFHNKELRLRDLCSHFLFNQFQLTATLNQLQYVIMLK